jgi:hypothetical protein
MIINIHTENRSHEILALSFGRSRFSLLNLGLARLDQLVGSDVVLILGKTPKPEIITSKRLLERVLDLHRASWGHSQGPLLCGMVLDDPCCYT